MNNIIGKEIDGVLYKARFMGVAFSIELNEKLENNTASYEIAEILFSEVLVSPKIEIDDFADMETYLRVFDFLLDVASGNFGKPIRKSRLKKRARDNWSLWRLIFGSDGAIDYQTVFGKSYMTPQDIIEANYALDMKIEAEKKAARKR